MFVVIRSLLSKRNTTIMFAWVKEYNEKYYENLELLDDFIDKVYFCFKLRF